MWPSESDLEPIESIIDRMNPIFGFPYPMKSAKNEGFPKSVGDPWIGSYTKNGYWFKLSWGGNDEFAQIANEMWYRNEFLVDSKSFQLYQNALGKPENLKLLVAKNIRNEILGIATLAENSLAHFSTVGALFVQEDFRHVGIGSVLMKEVSKGTENIAFNSISYLFPTVKNFELTPKSMRTFGRFRVKNSSGFESLMTEKSGLILKFGKEIKDDQWEQVQIFGEECTTERRNWKAFVENEEKTCQLIGAFDEESNTCVGLSVLREIQNEDGQIPDLLVSPLYAKTTEIAEIVLRKTLKKHYNPDDDYDFDVDHWAIYRRSVNFFVFSHSEPTVVPLLNKLAGSSGKVERDRLNFQTFSNFQLPAINHDSIFAISDPNIYLS